MPEDMVGSGVPKISGAVGSINVEIPTSCVSAFGGVYLTTAPDSVTV